jgi:hypothetical protein
MIHNVTKRHIRFVTVEKPTAWIIVAILLETSGSETIALSEPRVVRVIPKKTTFTLPGKVIRSNTKILPEPVKNISSSARAIVSPYFNVFGYKHSHFITWFSARPPTAISR